MCGLAANVAVAMLCRLFSAALDHREVREAIVLPRHPAKLAVFIAAVWVEIVWVDTPEVVQISIPMGSLRAIYTWLAAVVVDAVILLVRSGLLVQDHLCYKF